jgi:hypothetical protein
MQELLSDAANLPGRHRFADGHAQHPVSGNRCSRNQIPAPKRAQTLWLLTSAIRFSTVLLLAALTALLGCSLVSPVLLPDGTGADEGPVEDAEFSLADCRAHTATLLQDIAVLQRSLSQFAHSLAVSKARELRWKRAARRLQHEIAALRRPLEAPPFLEEMPETTAASSQQHSRSHTPQLSPDAGRIRYPATLPASGAQLAGDWHGFSQSWHARTTGACMSGARVPGFCTCSDACVSTACDRGRRYPDPHAPIKTTHRAPLLAFVLLVHELPDPKWLIGRD